VILSVDGQMTCISSASYGTKPEYIQQNAEVVHTNGALTHIGDMGGCQGDYFTSRTIAKG
jgi:hypothetical protein